MPESASTAFALPLVALAPMSVRGGLVGEREEWGCINLPPASLRLARTPPPRELGDVAELLEEMLLLFFLRNDRLERESGEVGDVFFVSTLASALAAASASSLASREARSWAAMSTPSSSCSPSTKGLRVACERGVVVGGDVGYEE